MNVHQLEKDLQEKIQSLPHPISKVYFNKGL